MIRRTIFCLCEKILFMFLIGFWSVFEIRNYQFIGLWALKNKIKNTLFFSSFKIEGYKVVIYFLFRAHGLSYSLFLTLWAYFIPKDLLAAVNTFKIAEKFETSYFWIQSYQMRPILEKNQFLAQNPMGYTVWK